ncbi:MAG: NAD(P)/FAD-dependent oxidoreductase [Nitrososphaerota archaeon]
MPSPYDVIVIGAGPNGLTAAAYLARSRLNVLIIDRNSDVGGGVWTEEITLPGHKHNTHANFFVNLINNPVYRDLQLAHYGAQAIMPDCNTGAAFKDGTAVVLHRDIDVTVRSLARLSEKDARTYRALYEKFGRTMGRVLASLSYNPPLPLDDLRKMIRGDLGEEFIRFSTMTMYDAVDENFEDERVRTFLKLVIHSFQYDNDPMTGGALPRLIALINTLCLVRGGAANLAKSFKKVIVENGGSVWTGRHVDRILVKDGRALGVILSDGSVVEARKAVVSAVDFPQTVRMAGEENWDSEIVQKARGWKWGLQSLLVLHLALREPPDYISSKTEPLINQTFNIYFGVDDSRELEENHRQLKSGQLPEKPAGNSACNTLFDPSYAPAGQHVAFWWPHAPFRIAGGGWDELKGRYGDYLLGVWSEYAPNLKASLLAKTSYSPLDTFRHSISMGEGSVHLGAYIPDQMGINRPHPMLSNYRTPIAGLYLAGSTSYPGGSVSFAPGYNCVNVLLDDLGMQKWFTPMPKPEWGG